MTAEQLKASVLQMAISGELTADWRDEQGVDLSSWQETTSTDLFEYVTSGSRGWNKFYSDHGAFFIRIGNLSHGTIEIDYSKVQYVDLPNKAEGKRSIIKDGDILISITADIGMIGLAQNVDYEGYINQHIALARPADIKNSEFIAWYLVSSEGQQQLRNNQRGATKAGIGLDDIRGISISLPSHEEQLEIVRRIKAILPLIEEYGKAHSDLKNAEEALPDQLRASLFQEAIQGKLVPQLDAEPAVDMAGEEPDEVPFAIPEKWKWVRIEDVFTLQAGKFISASEIQEKGTFPCYGGNGLRGYVEKFNRKGRYPLIGRQGALCGNINMAEGEFYATEHAVVVDCHKHGDPDCVGYFLRAMNLNQYATATAQPGLAVKNINKLFFPLPPLAEQRRIVARLEELLPHVDAIAGLR